MGQKFNIGDRVRILTKPNQWAGNSGSCPFNLSYPYEGVITKENNTGYSIGGYGFSKEVFKAQLISCLKGEYDIF